MPTESVAAKKGGRLVVVDDEPVVTDILSRRLVRDGYDVTTASTAAEARAAIMRGGVEILLADIQMPGESGLQLLAWARGHDPDLAVVMITAVATVSTAVDALKAGAGDYILKPFNLEQVSLAVRRGLDRRRLVVENRHYRERLEVLVEEKTRAHAAALSEIQQTYDATLKALGAALSYREGSARHADRVSAIALALGNRLGVASDDLDALERAILLHDIGKIAIPDGILTKREAFTEQEVALLRDHPRKGYALLSRIAFLRPAAAIVHAQAERWDGGGPLGLAREAIPLGARIFAVANAYDEMTAGRLRERLDDRAARSHLRDGAGREFDPLVVDTFVALPPDVIPSQ